jgi:hypothetical protein
MLLHSLSLSIIDVINARFKKEGQPIKGAQKVKPWFLREQ